MDELRLRDLLTGVETPAIDGDAKQRAVNLALAAFDRDQTMRQAHVQGLSLWRRLTGMFNTLPRSRPMTATNKRLIFGGMATAMTVVLMVGVALEQRPHVANSPTAPMARTDETREFAQLGHEELLLESETAVESETAERTVTTFSDSVPTASETKVFSLMDNSDAMADRTAIDARSLAPRVQQNSIAWNDPTQSYYRDVGRDQFDDFEENPVKLVAEQPVSTFSVDVDTASYAFVRSQLMSGVLPQKDAVRIEELVNYFDYDYPQPDSTERPFRATVAVTPSPWNAGNKLIHIGIKGYDVARDVQPRSNLVFLLDVSGSMDSPDKLPLVVNSLKLLLGTLRPDDTVAIVVYAGAAGTVLEPTRVADKARILNALDNLQAGGSTAGAEGIRQAYQLAEAGFDAGAVNRVILATDGDFNVGITNPEELQDFVERKRETGIFLSVLGFGQGNLNDRLMQTLAQNGNGVAAYIDTLNEARKVLVEEATSTLFPIAKDVKIQVEFNPATVAEYRLVGYETRALNPEDFINDAVDAGDIGAGHTVTAIYEITPVGGPRAIDDSRYGQPVEPSEPTSFSNEYAFLKIRYKLPDQDVSKLITTPISTDDEVGERGGAQQRPNWGREFDFATAVASFGQLLKGGTHAGAVTYDDVIAMAQASKGDDPFGYRAEFIQLVRMAESAAAMP